MTENTLEGIVSLLEENAEKLKSGKLSLDENIALYNQSTELYKKAIVLLNSFKQKIEIYNPETQEVNDFDYE